MEDLIDQHLALEVTQLICRTIVLTKKPRLEILNRLKDLIKTELLNAEPKEDSTLGRRLVDNRVVNLAYAYGNKLLVRPNGSPLVSVTSGSVVDNTKLLLSSTMDSDSISPPKKNDASKEDSLVKTDISEDLIERFGEEVNELANDARVKNEIQFLNRIMPKYEDDANQFLNDQTATSKGEPIVIPAEHRGLKKFVIVAEMNERYHGSNRQPEHHFYDPKTFIGFAKRLASAVNHGTSKDNHQEVIVNMLQEQFSTIRINRTTYYCSGVCSTPDAVILNEDGTVNTVFEFKGIAPREDGTSSDIPKDKSAALRHVQLSMLATGASIGYLQYHTHHNRRSAVSQDFRIFNPIKVTLDEEDNEKMKQWLEMAKVNTHLFWKTFERINLAIKSTTCDHK